ncbi:hypothetical protein pdam_00011774 [Pocillopora damicornis]|uniref:Uncharacterized protein n=1 Tax=Pocillopora damicornis TaxID=46731 RepID=A0A3M6U239_POCDA|nr:hypothetical protein pdam_00011774 [Pocillopora damicornis]
MQNRRKYDALSENRRATRQRAAGRPGLEPGPSGKRNTGKTRANAPPINPKGKQANSKKPPKKDTKTTPNKKKQKTASTVVVIAKCSYQMSQEQSLPESNSSTLPSLTNLFKKPERQQGITSPTRNFRKHYMSRSWDENYMQINPLHDIMEEEEDEF